MKPSRSEFLDVRGLRYHLRCWGPDGGRPVLVLHGFMDVSATWQFVVDHLPGWRIIAPDWRGFGLTDWRPDTYWFLDYVADLDAIVRHLAGPRAKVDIIGHSMGSQVASLYAGMRNTRVRRMAVLDGFYIPDMAPQNAPLRARQWLDKLAEQPTQKRYDSYEDLAARVARRHPSLSAEQAAFVAQAWGEDDGDGGIRLRADPRHLDAGPLLFRAAEAYATWKHITAPVLWIDAKRSNLKKWVAPEEHARRRESMGRVRLEELDFGHMLHFEAPRETALAIKRFFNAREADLP